MNEFLWVEKYRPANIADCVLPDRIKQNFEEIVKQGEIPNMLLCGTAGTGKTTVAKALCNELGVDYILINGSDESGIDVLRTKIRDFASTVSFGGQTKVVILDEADYLNPNSTQLHSGHSLRSSLPIVDSSSLVISRTESSNLCTLVVR